LNARKDALKSIIERKIELQLNLSDNESPNDEQNGENLNPEQADQIKKELAILEGLEKDHHDRVEKAIERIQTTLDTYKDDLEEIKQGMFSQNVILRSLSEVCMEFTYDFLNLYARVSFFIISFILSFSFHVTPFCKPLFYFINK